MAVAEGAVTVEKDLRIPMPDGLRLAADLYRPVEPGRWPAILTLIPYHKDGRGGRLDVEAIHRHFAARGYAALTVDLRGLGGSEGASPLPFDPQEAADGRAVVEWVAAQPWCDGRVGLWGISYGGIMALAVAATRPEPLRAIVPVHAGADLYHDVVAPGGCRGGFWLGADWGPRMVAYNLMPPLHPDPEGRWARLWAERLEANGPWLFAWWDHPAFDAFWQARAIPVEQIACPTLAIGGWRDLYAEATVRDWARVRAPKRLLMGPWKHAFPDVALEAPAAALHEIERWWERWLRGKSNGVDAEPPVTLYVQGDAPGWRHERGWPPPGLRPTPWYLRADGTLAPEPGSGGAPPLACTYDPTVGIASLAWDPWTTLADPTLPRDQSRDDARSLTFTSAPLARPLEIVGSPVAELELEASAAPLFVVGRLGDVAPDGRSTLVTAGWVDPRLRPGEVSRVSLPLRATAYRVGAGHRLRFAVACADFPRLWPTPLAATLRVHPGGSRLRLPAAAADPGLPPPVWGPVQPHALRSPADLGGGQRWRVQEDLGAGVVGFEGAKEEHLQLDPLTRLHLRHRYQARVAVRRPDLARMQSVTDVRIERPVGGIRLRVRTVTTTERVTVTAAVTLDGSPFWRRTWSRAAGRKEVSI